MLEVNEKKRGEIIAWQGDKVDCVRWRIFARYGEPEWEETQRRRAMTAALFGVEQSIFLFLDEFFYCWSNNLSLMFILLL